MSGFRKFVDIEAWLKANLLSRSIYQIAKSDNFDLDRRLRYQVNVSAEPGTQITEHKIK